MSPHHVDAAVDVTADAGGDQIYPTAGRVKRSRQDSGEADPELERSTGRRLVSPSGGLELWPQRSRLYRRAGPASRAPTASEKRGRNPNGAPATSAPTPTSPAEAGTGFQAGSKDEPELGRSPPPPG